MDTFLNICIAGVNDLGRGFCSHATGVFLQSGILIVVLLSADLLLRRHIRATLRYWIWMLVIVKLLLPPTLSLPTGVGHWLGGYVALPSLMARQVLETAESHKTPGPAMFLAMPVPQSNAGMEAALTAPAESIAVPAVRLTQQGGVVLLWGVGALGFAGLVLRRVFFVRRLVTQGRPARGDAVELLEECRRGMNIHQKVALKVLPGAFSPAVCGLWRPTILLPQTLPARLAPDNLRAVLIHELAHVKRADLWVSCLQTILQVVYFYNPLVWLANANVRRVREQAVDEMSLVALGAEARSYSNTLIDIAEMAFGRANPALGLVGVAESKRALEGRIRHMITRPIPKNARVGVVGLSAILLAAAVLLPMARAQDPAKRTGDTSGADDRYGVRRGEPAGAQTDPSMVAWWKLDDATGTVIADSSGNGIDGNLVGNPMWVAGMRGGALRLDGSSAVSFGNPRKTALTGPLTIACWIRPENLGTSARIVGGAQDRAFVARDGAYAFKASGPNLRFTTPWIRDHEATRTFLRVGQWQHVAVTFQPGRTGGCVFYLDGVESDRTDASTLKPGSGPVRIGNTQWPAGECFNGMIDDVRLYSRALTAGEIQALVGDGAHAQKPQAAPGAPALPQGIAELFGLSKDDLLAKYGQPDFIFYGENRYTLDNLPEQYYMSFREPRLSFRIWANRVVEITLLGPAFVFGNGVRVGDSEAKVKEAFGPDFVIEESQSKDFLVYPRLDLSFEIYKPDRLAREINIRRDYGRASQ